MSCWERRKGNTLISCVNLISCFSCICPVVDNGVHNIHMMVYKEQRENLKEGPWIKTKSKFWILFVYDSYRKIVDLDVYLTCF